MMIFDTIKALITNIKFVCLVVFIFASASSAADVQDKDIFNECNYEKSISKSFFNWKDYPNFACEMIGENCDLVDEKEKDHWPKYEDTDQIENICKTEVQSHIDTGMKFEAIVTNLELSNLSCKEQPESWAKRMNKKRLVRCIFNTFYEIPKSVALRYGSNRSFEISISFSTTIVEELNGELNVSTNFSSMFP